MNKVVIGLISVAVLVAVAAGSFWAGTRVGEARAEQTRQQFFQQRFGGAGQGGQFPAAFGTPQPGGGVRLGGGIMGTIEAVEGEVLIVATREGTVRVRTTDTTLIEKYMSARVGDLKVGEQVVVSGSRNDDGSVTARSIQSMPASRFQQINQP